MLRILTFCTYPLYMGFHTAVSDIGVYVRAVFNGYGMSYLQICKLIDEVKPNFIFTIGRPEIHVDFEALKKACKDKGIFHVYWATEDRTYHQRYSIKIAESADFVFTPAEECLEGYKRIGKPCSLLRYGYYPPLHNRREPDEKYRADITIAASFHERLQCDYVINQVLGTENNGEEILRKTCIDKIVIPLVERGYHITIWGEGWDTLVPQKFFKGYLNYYELPVLYSSSKIVLGLEWDNISETKTTGRPFEVLGCQAFFLSYRTKALSNIFEDRKHLALTDSEEETLELVNYYLKHDTAREAIAAEGYKEVHNHHTCYQRAHEFIEALKPHI